MKLTMVSAEVSLISSSHLVCEMLSIQDTCMLLEIVVTILDQSMEYTVYYNWLLISTSI